MRDLLAAHAAYDEVRVLRDGEATCAAILAGLRWLVSNAIEGDSLWFHFSGHGTQIRDVEGDELSDTLDECLCPVDWNWDDPTTQLTDDKLHDILVEAHLPAGVDLTLVLDSCHSGTMLRDIDDPDTAQPQISWGVPRFLPPPLRMARRVGHVFRPKTVSRFGRAATVIPGAVLISGCADGQTSADAYINNEYRGAATFALTHAVADGATTPRTTVELMRTWLTAEVFDQVPQLEGDTALFDVRFWS